MQHQLLVALKGHPGRIAPSVRQIADYLMLQSNSVVGLVDRAEVSGFVRRRPDSGDGRVVRVELTEMGDRVVTELAEAHLLEVHKLAIALRSLLPADAGGLITGRLRGTRTFLPVQRDHRHEFCP